VSGTRLTFVFLQESVQLTDGFGLTGIWFLVGLASRMAVDHGLHHETSQSDNLTPLELDMNRRLFYSVFNLDRLLCHALGRPPSIPDTFVSVPVSQNVLLEDRRRIEADEHILSAGLFELTRHGYNKSRSPSGRTRPLQGRGSELYPPKRTPVYHLLPTLLCQKL
jgi:hypothetical protein